MALSVKLFEPLSDEALLRLSSLNHSLRLERSASGALLVSPPTGGESGAQNAALGAQLFVWNKAFGHGVVFGSSTGFKLPDSSVLSPDASWIDRLSWDALPAKQRFRYPPICPRVAFELVSPTDDVGEARDKIQAYLANGCALAVLLDPFDRVVEVYAPGEDVRTIEGAKSLLLEKRFFRGALSDLVIDLAEIFGSSNIS